MNERQEVCKYIETVFCYPSERKCEKCGWNPKVAKRREAKILKQHYVERCVCCGAIIPEGRQVCPACEGGIQGEDTR